MMKPEADASLKEATLFNPTANLPGTLRSGDFDGNGYSDLLLTV